jgi:small-conductance mechanosensitive channel
LITLNTENKIVVVPNNKLSGKIIINTDYGSTTSDVKFEFK